MSEHLNIGGFRYRFRLLNGCQSRVRQAMCCRYSYGAKSCR